MKRRFCLLLLLISLSGFSFAQGKMIKIEDVQNRKYYIKEIYDVQFMGKSDSYSFTKDGKTLWIGNLKQEPKESLRLEDISPKPSVFMGIKYILQ